MFLVEEGLFTSCSRQSFPIVLFHLHFLALGWTDLESDNCIKFRHIQTTFLPKIRFICVEVFLKIEVNQIGSTFHSCEPNWVPHWYARWKSKICGSQNACSKQSLFHVIWSCEFFDLSAYRIIRFAWNGAKKYISLFKTTLSTWLTAMLNQSCCFHRRQC